MSCLKQNVNFKYKIIKTIETKNNQVQKSGRHKLPHTN